MYHDDIIDERDEETFWDFPHRTSACVSSKTYLSISVFKYYSNKLYASFTPIYPNR